MTKYKLPNIGLEEAREGNTDAARLQIERMIEIIRLSPHADDEEKEYFINNLVGVACAYDAHSSLPKRQRAVTIALGLSKSRGRENNDISKDFAVVVRIDEIMREHSIGVEPAIQKLLKHPKDPVLRNIPNIDAANVKRLYYRLSDVLEIKRKMFQEMMDSSVIQMRLIN